MDRHFVSSKVRTITLKMKKMKKLLVLMTLGIALYACSQGGKQSNGNDAPTQSTANPEDYDPTRGEGKFDHVDVGDHLDVAMAKEGKTIADLKCASCHKYTDERLVG